MKLPYDPTLLCTMAIQLRRPLGSLASVPHPMAIPHSLLLLAHLSKHGLRLLPFQQAILQHPAERKVPMGDVFPDLS